MVTLQHEVSRAHRSQVLSDDGQTVREGTRIPVYLLLEKMAAGETSEQLLATYPQLAIEDLRACLEYAAALATDEVIVAEA
jgi:uncharacterized protein (DUF433 family)